MTALARQWCYFLAALRYFTRIPVPSTLAHSQTQLDHASLYFPAVGCLVGGVGALASWLALQVLPATLAVLLGMAATLWLTGAFHEDGFADSCDGFGGGWQREQILAIMKDSRLGSYGVIGITLMLLAKWQALLALTQFDEMLLILALIAAHTLSRTAAVMLMQYLPYARDEGGKTKPLARPATKGLPFLPLFTGLVSLLLFSWIEAVWLIATSALTTLFAGRYFRRRIGGYTGDCLGATQQLVELMFYLVVVCAHFI